MARPTRRSPAAYLAKTGSASLASRTRSFEEKFIFQCYELAKAGVGRAGVADALGVHAAVLTKWMKETPLLEEAYQRGKKISRKEKTPVGRVDSYIVDRLPGHLKDLYDKIVDADALHGASAGDAVEHLLRGRGTRTRQHLYLHALVRNAWNPNAAARMVNVTPATRRMWEQDQGFREMVAHILACRKDFVEGALMKKVEEGDTSAIIFASKTLNRDRGYGDKVDVQHGHTVAVVDVDKLDLTLDEKRSLLGKVRAQRQLALAAAPEADHIQDAEVVPNEEKTSG